MTKYRDYRLKITFLGAVQTVTGSKYLIQSGGKKVLIDCGLFQGYKELRQRNWKQLPVPPSQIDAVILTHAHMDHSGYIPILIKNGFKGKVYCSEATYDLCSLLLPDSGYIQEEDAKRANKYGYTKHRPALPLYTKQDAEIALKQFYTVGYNKKINIDKTSYFILYRSGHILGSSFIYFSDGNQDIIFSGDLGRPNDPILKAGVKLKDVDYIVVESTYGDRLHDNSDPGKEIAQVINETINRGGKVVIPAFAVGRAQHVLYYIYRLKQSGSIPDIPVFLDSPMAINVTNLLWKHASEHKLSKKLCQDICNVAFYTDTVDLSRRINDLKSPCIIISASGMATGGRVLHHLEHLIADPSNTILFTGYQAGGTRGDRLLKGEKNIKIHGAIYNVRAKIESLSSLSAHADYKETLSWLTCFKRPPKKVFITHGELPAALSLQNRITTELHWQTLVPSYGQTENL